MGHHLVKFFKGTLIQQKFDALARRHFAFFVLAFATLFPATLFSQDVTALQFRKLLFQIHGWNYMRKVNLTTD